ncbi:sulfurtransferase [Halalkalibacter alkalisediminis]|uniref:thiosulfate sulfurtransferase n=1 Tax=Halalkalibacter alkalisediminis TaxID=935616 RepID=A0ABV6NFT3_9BACI|nr:sulfurtransferase [Halalkalibacter alkalisediminis]
MKILAILLLFIVVTSFGLKELGFAQSLDYSNAPILMTVEDVEKTLKDENRLIVDVRKEGYASGHIPGAISFDMELLIDKEHPVEGHLIQEEAFEKIMREHGVNNDQTVIIYDQGRETDATRLFYALEYFGHKDVRVLDGGFTAWEAANKKTETQTFDAERGDFSAKENRELRMEKEEVKQVIGKENVVLLDVRSPGEYKGEDVRSKRGGHIPSAVNLEWTNVLTEEDVSRFKSADEIETLLEAEGVKKDKKVVVYCQKANRASHMYFTLRLLGYEDLSVYEGSWEEWGNDPKTPIIDPSKVNRELRSL